MTTQGKKRRWPVIVAVPVALILIFALVVKLYFTDERLRTLILPEIEAATHRSAGMGSVSLSLFPDIGITVNDFSLSNPPGTEYPHPHLLSLRRLFIDVKLLPLFSRRLEVNRLVVEDPVVYLDVTGDGRKNYSAGGGARAAGGAADGGSTDGGSTGAFLLANMEIVNGRIESHNRKLDTRWTAAGLNQTLRMEGTGGPSAIMIEGSSRIDSFSYGSGSSWLVRDLPLDAELHLSYRPVDDWLDFRDVRVRLKEVPLTVSGSVRNLQQETLLLDLSVDAPDLALAHLLSLLPSGEDAGEVAATGRVQFSMKVLGESSDDTNPSISAVFSVADGTARYASLPRTITGIAMEGTMEMPQAAVGRKDIGDLRIDRLTATLGDNVLNGVLRVTNFGDPSISASLRGDIALGEIGDYYPLPQGTELSGRLKSDVVLNGKAGDPRTMKASGTMVMRDVLVSSPGMARPVRDLNGEMKFNNRILEMKNVSLLMGGSDIALDASLDNYLGILMPEETAPGNAPLLNFSLRSRTLRTADLAAGTPDSTAPENSGAGGGKGGGMLLPGIDMAGTVAIDTLQTEKFTFTGTRGTLSSSGGVVQLQRLRLEAFEGTISTSGTLDLRDPAVRPFDLKLNVEGVQSHSFLQPFTTFGKYLFGKLTLSTEMKGILDDTLGIRTADLSGKGDALVSDGKLSGVPLLQSLSGYLNAERLRDVDFRSWTQSFSVADGRVKVSDLNIGGTDADITVNGFHGLDGSMDYSLRIRLPKTVADQIRPAGITGELVQFFRDREGGMSFDFNVTGAMDSPVVKLDTRAQEELLRKKLQDDAAKKLGDPLKKAADALKKLIKP